MAQPRRGRSSTHRNASKRGRSPGENHRLFGDVGSLSDRMQRMPAQKRRDHLHDLAETNKLLVPAGFPAVTRDYRLVIPGGELTLFPEPATIPPSEHATADFRVMFFPDLGRPIDVTDWEEARWLELLRTRIEELRAGG
jgi:hypothetical protein